jgi:hypothetical protein
MPGYEDDVPSSLVPRLAAAGVALERCLLLDGRLWSMPSDRRALLAALHRHQADFLWIDPIDSYCGECSENDGQLVRQALECLSGIAQDGPIAVVAARHPGKATGNLCPGSRSWRAVPRVIIEMGKDDGPPLRRWLRGWKWPYEPRIAPREVHIEGEAGAPGVLSLGDPLARGEDEVMSITDHDQRTLIDQAQEIIRAVLADGEKTIKEVYAATEVERISERTVRVAARRLGVQTRREGTGQGHIGY